MSGARALTQLVCLVVVLGTAQSNQSALTWRFSSNQAKDHPIVTDSVFDLIDPC
jgi:hypothetical protein